MTDDLERIERTAQVLDHLPREVLAELHVDADRLVVSGSWLTFGGVVVLAPVEGGAVLGLLVGGGVTVSLYRDGVEVESRRLG